MKCCILPGPLFGLMFLPIGQTWGLGFLALVAHVASCMEQKLTGQNRTAECSSAGMTEALERLVQLYEATGQKEKAAHLRKRLEAEKAAAKPAAKP